MYYETENITPEDVSECLWQLIDDIKSSSGGIGQLSMARQSNVDKGLMFLETAYMWFNKE